MPESLASEIEARFLGVDSTDGDAEPGSPRMRAALALIRAVKVGDARAVLAALDAIERG